MRDEERFYEYMVACGKFDVVLPFPILIRNPRYPGSKVEVDNAGQKDKKLFVFEGKKGKVDISQSKERFFLFDHNKTLWVRFGLLNRFDTVRVFHYNLKEKRLVEFDRRGAVVQTFKYMTVQQLIAILAKI